MSWNRSAEIRHTTERGTAAVVTARGWCSVVRIDGEVLAETCGFGVENCGQSGATFVYLDDAIFTGNRVRRDLEAWIANDAPAKATLHIICIAVHSGGQYYAGGYISNAARAAKKAIDVTWWRAIELEDRKTYTDRADVLRPPAIPDVAVVKTYVAAMKYPPTLRKPGNAGANALFSSEESRSLLEREFLIAGVSIRTQCPHLGDTQRPLGHMTLDTLGFGSMIVTFRELPEQRAVSFVGR